MNELFSDLDKHKSHFTTHGLNFRQQLDKICLDQSNSQTQQEKAKFCVDVYPLLQSDGVDTFLPDSGNNFLGKGSDTVSKENTCDIEEDDDDASDCVQQHVHKNSTPRFVRHTFDVPYISLLHLTRRYSHGGTKMFVSTTPDSSSSQFRSNLRKTKTLQKNGI